MTKNKNKANHITFNFIKISHTTRQIEKFDSFEIPSKL